MGCPCHISSVASAGMRIPGSWKGPALPACTVLALSLLFLQQLAGKGALLHSGSNFKLPGEGSLLIPSPRAWSVPAPGSGVKAPAARRLGQGWSPPGLTCGSRPSSPSWGTSFPQGWCWWRGRTGILGTPALCSIFSFCRGRVQ